MNDSEGGMVVEAGLLKVRMCGTGSVVNDAGAGIIVSNVGAGDWVTVV